MVKIKRLFDFSLALAGIIFSLPVSLIIAMAIWLDDGRRVFYLQDRVGKDGALFKSVKFRTMSTAAEEGSGPVQASENDTRVTRIGRFLRKTALDELPQLWNILKGQMSFVGPRALRPMEQGVGEGAPKGLSEFEGYRERISVVPGLTGVAQVFASRFVSRQDKFKLDIWYIRNQGFLLDLRLILLSFMVSILGRWEARGDKLKIFILTNEKRYLKI